MFTEDQEKLAIQRYQNDSAFHALVDCMANLMEHRADDFYPDVFSVAIHLATIKCNERLIRRLEELAKR